MGYGYASSLKYSAFHYWMVWSLKVMDDSHTPHLQVTIHKTTVKTKNSAAPLSTSVTPHFTIVGKILVIT